MKSDSLDTMTHSLKKITACGLLWGLLASPFAAVAQPPLAPVIASVQASPHVEPGLVPSKGAALPVSVVHDRVLTVLKADQTVSFQLQKLAAGAGWVVIWEAPDFLVEQSVTLSGDFFQVTAAIVDSIQATGTPVKATFYKGNQILRIVGE